MYLKPILVLLGLGLAWLYGGPTIRTQIAEAIVPWALSQVGVNNPVPQPATASSPMATISAQAPSSVVTPISGQQVQIPPSASQAAPPGPPRATIIVDEYVCGNPDYINVVFTASRPPPGSQYWILVRPRGQSKYYPSDALIWDENELYQQEIATGPADVYDVMIVLLPPKGAGQVAQYLDDRKQDGDWARGIRDMPVGAAAVTLVSVERKCHVLASPTPNDPLPHRSVGRSGAQR